jgi:hypothetical protein
MGLFGKESENNNKEELNLNIPPIDKVILMRVQGLTNNQIIQSLQKTGYDPNIILEAMNQADIKQGIEEQAPQNYQEPQNIENPMQYPMAQEEQLNNPQEINSNAFNMQPPQNYSENTNNQIQNPLGNQMFTYPSEMPNINQNTIEQISIERIEEIAEAIIDEKWNEIVRSINKIIDWKERTEEKIIRIDQKFIELRKDFESLNHGVLNKIDDYDKNLGDLGVEIKAMERVFQKIIPSLTENVHSLEKITTKFKNQE